MTSLSALVTQAGKAQLLCPDSALSFLEVVPVPPFVAVTSLSGFVLYEPQPH